MSEGIKKSNFSFDALESSRLQNVTRSKGSLSFRFRLSVSVKVNAQASKDQPPIFFVFFPQENGIQGNWHERQFNVTEYTSRSIDHNNMSNVDSNKLCSLNYTT